MFAAGDGGVVVVVVGVGVVVGIVVAELAADI